MKRTGTAVAVAAPGGSWEVGTPRLRAMHQRAHAARESVSPRVPALVHFFAVFFAVDDFAVDLPADLSTESTVDCVAVTTTMSPTFTFFRFSGSSGVTSNGSLLWSFSMAVPFARSMEWIVARSEERRVGKGW